MGSGWGRRGGEEGATVHCLSALSQTHTNILATDTGGFCPRIIYLNSYAFFPIIGVTLYNILIYNVDTTVRINIGWDAFQHLIILEQDSDGISF